MGSEWKVARLGDLVESCLGKMLDQNKNKGEPYPYLGNKSVRWGSFDLNDLALMPFEDHEHERYGLKYGDLIICEGGEPGRCAIWKDEVPNMKIQKALHRVRPKKGLNNVYLYYWFLWAGKNDRLHQYFTGTTIKHLTGKALSSVEITIPPLQIQNDIAEFLSSLDNKITLNRQLNQTLEQMAQALFKSWFVDFDPVIDNALAAGNVIPDDLQDRAERRQLQLAKADHKPLPENIRKLFPSEFELTESLGWVPKGWGEGTLADVASYATEKVNTAELSLETYISTENMNAEKSGICSAAILPGSDQVPKFVNGQTLISNIRPYFKKIWLASFSGGRSADVLGFKAKNKGTNEYLFNLLYQDTFFDYMMATSKGTKMPRGDKSAIMSWPAVKPSPKLMEVFSNTVKPFYSANQLRSNQSSALSEARDTLLPKLISGELRIPEAQAQLEAVLG